MYVKVVGVPLSVVTCKLASYRKGISHPHIATVTSHCWALKVINFSHPQGTAPTLLNCTRGETKSPSANHELCELSLKLTISYQLQPPEPIQLQFCQGKN